MTSPPEPPPGFRRPTGEEIAQAATVAVRIVALIGTPCSWWEITEHEYVKGDACLPVGDGVEPVPLRTALNHAARHGWLWNNTIDDRDVWGATDLGLAHCTRGRDYRPPSAPGRLREAVFELQSLANALEDQSKQEAPDGVPAPPDSVTVARYDAHAVQLAAGMARLALAAAAAGYALGPAPFLDRVCEEFTALVCDPARLR